MSCIDVPSTHWLRLRSRLLSTGMGACCALLLGAPVDAQTVPAVAPLSPPIATGLSAGLAQPPIGNGYPGLVTTSSHFIVLPKLRVKEVENLIDDICSELQLNYGFQRNRSRANPAVAPVDEAVIYRSVAIGTGDYPNVVYFGYLFLPRQSPQLWVYSDIQQPLPSGLDVSATSPLLDGVIKAVFAKTADYQAHLSLQDLRSDVINLSYVDADGALYALRAMGFSAITSDQGLFEDDSFKGMIGNAPPEGPPQPGAGGMGLTGDAAAAALAAQNGQQGPNAGGMMGGGMMGGMMGGYGGGSGYGGGGLGGGSGSGVGGGGMANASIAGMSMTSPLATPVTNGANAQLMILSDPNDPSQLYRIRAAIDSIVDKPAKQVYIEAMIIEVDTDALRQLGVQWQGAKGKNSLTIGALGPIAAGTGQALLFHSMNDSAPSSFSATINALVNKNLATIMSRPSVITLDNRQAAIKVGTDIPIANTTTNLGVSSSSFSYQSTGISLNVRPRVSQDNSEISLLIDASVTTVVPGADVSITNATGQVLTSAPTINSRKVETYARVPNSNPLILAGLVNETKSTQTSGVPYLSAIPGLGKLFSYESPQANKTEVVIVLTPTVIPESKREIQMNYPKDSPLYNRLSDRLFRDQYRLTTQDSIPFYTSKRLTDAQRAADLIISKDQKFAKTAAITELAYKNIPGEDTLVFNSLSKIVARLKLLDSGAMNNEDLLVYRRDAGGVLSKESLIAIVNRFGGNTNKSMFFKPRQALTMTFGVPDEHARPGRGGEAYIPVIKLVDMGEDTTSAFVWHQNMPDAQEGLCHFFTYTIVIEGQDDLDRLKNTAIARQMLSLSGGPDILKIETFTPGRVINIGTLGAGTARLLDIEFAHDYVRATIPDQLFEAEQDSALDLFEATLNTPDVQRILLH